MKSKIFTLNELIEYVVSTKKELQSKSAITELNVLMDTLISMKNAPELVNNCNIDIKIDNSEFYIDLLNSIKTSDEKSNS
jgi:hypothetical protein